MLKMKRAEKTDSFLFMVYYNFIANSLEKRYYNYNKKNYDNI